MGDTAYQGDGHFAGWLHLASACLRPRCSYSSCHGLYELSGSLAGSMVASPAAWFVTFDRAGYWLVVLGCILGGLLY